MIRYETDGLRFIINVFRVHGSVFPKALKFSIPSSLLSAFFVYMIYAADKLKYFKDKDSVMNNNAIWGGFTFLVGFLVVFRTNQAYSRFWEGATQTHKMGAEWFDACSSLMAFCKHSEVEKDLIFRFQNLLVRLFSMLHAAALGEIEHGGDGSGLVWDLDLIDAESIDAESMEIIKECDSKVDLIFQWIQQLVVLNIKTGVLSVPPPILSRSFQEIAAGMVHFHEASKISNIPFPFPYVQTCDCLLLLHWLIVPFVVSQWVTRPWWAGLFSFIQVFTLWTLNLIAVELENPFGRDANDIDGTGMQLSMNNSLRLLLRADAMRTPSCQCGCLSQKQLIDKAISCDDRRATTFHAVWSSMTSDRDSEASSKIDSVSGDQVQITTTQASTGIVPMQTPVPVTMISPGLVGRSPVNSKADGDVDAITVYDFAGCWKELPLEAQSMWNLGSLNAEIASERRDDATHVPHNSVTCKSAQATRSPRKPGGKPPLLDGPHPPPAINHPPCSIPPTELSQMPRHSTSFEDGRRAEGRKQEEALQLKCIALSL